MDTIERLNREIGEEKAELKRITDSLMNAADDNARANFREAASVRRAYLEYLQKSLAGELWSSQLWHLLEHCECLCKPNTV
jgi:hypothetical protein